MLVGVSGQTLDHFTRRPVPDPVLGEVLAGGGVAATTGLVGQAQCQSAPLPLMPDPFLCGHPAVRAGDLEPSLVEDADLGNHGKPADGLAVDIAGDVPDPLVPGDCLHVIPSAYGKKRVHCGPADLGVPEPQGRSGT